MRNPDSTNSFEKGMSRDFNPKLQPQGTTRLAINTVYLSEDGDIYSLTNEKGTVEFNILPPNGYKIIGRDVLDKDIILFSVNPTNGFSQIGYVDSFTMNYTKVLPVSGENADLNFSIDHPIDVVSRKILTGERMVYWVDNYNPDAFTSLDIPPSTDIYDNTRINPVMDLPVVSYVETLENGGSLHGGVYQFAAQYLTRELNPMGYGIPCNPIPVVPNDRSVGRDDYEGAYPDNPVTIAKTLRLNITNIDDSFPFLQVVAIHYDTIANVFTAFAITPILNISPGETSKIIEYSGDNSESTPVLLNEINSIPNIYDHSKCIEQKDDTLIRSNLTQIQERFNFQEVANNIVTKYAIREVPYVDNEQGNAALFLIIQPPFIISDGDFVFYVKFSQPVDPTSATTLTNYEVIYDPNVPATTVTPTSVIVDVNDPSLVIVTMDDSIPAQAISEGVQVNILPISNYDLSQATTLQTFSIITDTPVIEDSNLFFADYKDEALTFDGKGLMREEIYSFGFGVVWNDGAQSPVYPIPGNDRLTTVTTDADTISRLTGTYVSSIDYPLNQGYPSTPDYSNGKIRHHKMPTLQQEPHYRVDSGGNVFIRILGVSFENIVIDPAVRSKIQSIFFVRQSRNVAQNRSIITQGVVNNMRLTANDYDYDTGVADPSSNVYKKNPFFNNFSFSNTTASAPFSGGDSVAWELGSNLPDIGALFSPDIILGDVDTSEMTKMKNVMLMTGVTQIPNFVQSTNWKVVAVGSSKFQLNKPLNLWVFGNYTNVDNTPFTPTERDILFHDIVQNGEKKRVANIFPDYDVDNSASGKFYLFKADGTIPTNNPNNISITFDVDTSFPGLTSGTEKVNDDSYSVPPVVQNYLYNFYKVNTSQYGAIDGTEFVFMSQSLNPNITSYTTFNGDTFISKFSYGNKDVWNYKGLYGTLILGVPSTNYLPARDFEPAGSPYKGVGLRGLGYFFVESTINVNYRHQFIPNGVKYFPKDNKFDTLAEDPILGDSNSYNTQYSYENNLRSFVTKPAVFFNTSGFETRSIYSQKAVLGETVDSYRIFPPNNFYDIPKHTGEIWDSFVENNVLYLHTPKALWRTFMNEVAQQTTDTTQIILGTSGIFTIPAKEVFTEKGGYAGTISQWAGVHTPFGYIFPDSLQGKIFMLSNQSLTELSADGMTRFFNDNLSVIESGDTGYIDNPFNPLSKGLLGVYDYDIKRYILTKYHVTPSKRYTVSYSLLTNSFASFHTYYPNTYVSINDKFYSVDNNDSSIKFYEHNVGPHGNYYGVVSPWNVQFVINKAPNYDKVLDSIGISMEVWDDNTGQFIHLRPSGDTLSCFTNNKHTGEIGLKYDNSIYATKLNSQEFVKWKGQRYQISIPMNSVINDTTPIFDKSTILNELLGTALVGNINQNMQFRGRMKGQFIVVNLQFSNENDYKTSIAMIDSNFRINAI